MGTTQKILINPPPTNGKCNCCKKNANSLKPFGKAGDPLVGNFNGALLVKTFRTEIPTIDRYEERLKELKSPEDWNELERKNEKEFNNLSIYDQLTNTVGASWECRDCICLDDNNYFKIQNKDN